MNLTLNQQQQNMVHGPIFKEGGIKTHLTIIKVSKRYWKWVMGMRAFLVSRLFSEHRIDRCFGEWTVDLILGLIFLMHENRGVNLRLWWIWRLGWPLNNASKCSTSDFPGCWLDELPTQSCNERRSYQGKVMSEKTSNPEPGNQIFRLILRHHQSPSTITWDAWFFIIDNQFSVNEDQNWGDRRPYDRLWTKLGVEERGEIGLLFIINRSIKIKRRVSANQRLNYQYAIIYI